MSSRANAYWFKTATQWQQCLLDGFEIGSDGSLQPLQRFGSAAYQVTTAGPISLIAGDPMAGPVWRMESGGRIVLVRQLAASQVSRPFEVDATLADCSRWVIDQEWLWGFDAAAPIVRRYDSRTVSEDLVVDLRDADIRPRPAGLSVDFAVRDLTSDGREGAWLLVAEREHRRWALHLDCQGRPGGIHPIPCDTRCGPNKCPDQLVSMLRGKRLVLLAADGRLVFVDSATGSVIRTVANWFDDPCWRAHRLISDGANRLGLLCYYCGDEREWAVFVFDANGDVIDTVKGPQPKLIDRPIDIAMSNGKLWFAVADGLWQLDSTDKSIARESTSVLLTPALLSPDTGTGGGWLRAEIQVALPRGAVLEAQAVATDDPNLESQARQLATGPSGSAAQQQDAIWNLLGPTDNPVFQLTAAGNGQPVGIPLFQAEGQWLWLRVSLVTPPGITPPAVTALRVLYPDDSVIQQVPRIFRGSNNDPGGFLRSLVGVIETTTQGIDDRIRGIADQITAATAPDDWLDYVARWLDLPWDDALPTDVKRRLVADGGALLSGRGTRRGLELVIRDLVGPKGQVRIVDVTGEYPPIRLGGDNCGSGARLPMVLAGPPRSAVILGKRAVLGRACLGTTCDPLADLVPTLRVTIVAPRSLRKVLDPLLPRILAQYVPAGVNVVISWAIVADMFAASGSDGEVLDAIGPGRLGDDSELGRTRLGRRGAGRLDSAGLDVGWRLS
jgi:phage tail-like protein